MSWKRTIWFRVAFGVAATTVVANSVLTAAIVLGVGRLLVGEVQTRVRLDLNSARTAYEGRADQIRDFLRAVSIRQSVPTPLSRDTLGELDDVLSRVRRDAGMDMLTLLDTSGRVILRVHNPPSSGDDLSRDPVVRRVLRRAEPFSGTIVVDRNRLRLEGEPLAERAFFRILPTQGARPTSQTTESRGMLLAAAAPVFDVRDPARPVAILYGAELLNRRYDIVDAIKGDVFQDETYEGKETGTATIFLGDLRIATNVLAHTGERAVGTRMSSEVRDRVIAQGRTWAARAFVVNDWYITAYEPIRDPDGRVVGALYVGLLEAPYAAARRTALEVFLATMAVTTLSSLALLFFATRAMLRPITRVVDMAGRVVGGDLSARTGIRPSGEMGALCQAIDDMAEAVEQREARLKAAAQEQLGRSEKLASVGRLAAGVAHEVNNPLTGVLTFAHLMQPKETLDEEDRLAVDVIIRETTRVRETVKGLLDYARELPLAMRVIDLNDVMRRTLALVRRQKEFRNLEIREEMSPDPLLVWGDRNRLQQVFLNLLLNAAQAMPDGGGITITSRQRDDGRAEISVADTGCGIPDADLPRIFEPFFTTKPIGSGTGLGLSISQGIVQQHKGTISVVSAPERGATFTVVLPPAPAGAHADDPEPSTDGGGR